MVRRAFKIYISILLLLSLSTRKQLTCCATMTKHNIGALAMQAGLLGGLMSRKGFFDIGAFACSIRFRVILVVLKS